MNFPFELECPRLNELHLVNVRPTFTLNQLSLKGYVFLEMVQLKLPPIRQMILWEDF